MGIKQLYNYNFRKLPNEYGDIPVMLRKAKFMFKISKSSTPSYINAIFTLRPINETLLSLSSVNTSNFQTPRPQKEIFKQSLIYSGPVIWNNLPN